MDNYLASFLGKECRTLQKYVILCETRGSRGSEYDSCYCHYFRGTRCLIFQDIIMKASSAVMETAGMFRVLVMSYQTVNVSSCKSVVSQN
jgi:hypothetical protein